MRTGLWIGAAAVVVGGVFWVESHCGDVAMAQHESTAAACCAADTDEPAIACTITDATAMQERKAETERLFRAAQKMVEIEHGYKLKFDRAVAEDLFDYARFESDCCAFIEFSITFERNHGPVWLELSGSSHAKRFIRSMLPEG